MESLTDVLVLLMFGGLIYKTIDMLRAAGDADWAPIRYQGLAWLIGVALIFVLAASELGSQIRIGDGYLYGTNLVSKVLLGTALASTMSIIHDAVSGRRNGTLTTERSNTVLP